LLHIQVSKVHSQGERYVQQARLIARPGRCQERLEFELVAQNPRRGQILALDPGVLRGAKTIGLAAGRSAPEILVEDLLKPHRLPARPN
jgi:4-hydroxy-3-methylbut-2-enyl diphosphate reductase IspH